VQPTEPNLKGGGSLSKAPQLVEGGGTVSEAEEPKRAAGYYWIKHINGDTDLTEAEKQKANEYNLTEHITRGIRFCTVCGDEEHWTYLCPEFSIAYKRPVVKKKRRNTEEYWQQKDEDLLHENCITAREIFEYLHQFSPKKIIHKSLVEQDRMIQMLGMLFIIVLLLVWNIIFIPNSFDF
jgi:hypothetical protein